MSQATPLQRRQARLAWFFVAPALAALAVVGLFPLLHTSWLAFTDAWTDGRSQPNVVGLANFVRLAGDDAFRAAFGNTIVFTLSSVGLEFLLGLALALVVHRAFPGRGALRAAILIPWALPTVVAARMWSWMLNDQFGVINDLLVRRLGLLEEPLAWTATPGLAMGAMVMVDVWKTTPFMALLLLAGLQLIPDELHEAAAVDGAGPVQRFFSITLPLLKPSILVALVFRTLDALRVFDVPWVLTNGQFGTETLATYIYRQLVSYFKLGYASAAGLVMFAAIALFVVAYVALLGRDSETAP